MLSPLKPARLPGEIMELDDCRVRQPKEMSMKPCTLLARAHAPARAALALGLALSLLASPAPAQQAKTTAPYATSTLDVCLNEANGKWRYSGVVTVLGAGEGKVAVSN